MSRDNSVRPVTTRETREADPVHPAVHPMQDEDLWRQPVNLTAPPPRAGMRQKWVRTAIGTVDDPSNIARAMQAGWRPRPADTVPSGAWDPPTIGHGKHAGCIGIHGMVLMEAPEEVVDLAAERQRLRTRKLTLSLDRDIKSVQRGLGDQSYKVPFEQERQTRVSVGRRPPIADDEAT